MTDAEPRWPALEGQRFWGALLGVTAVGLVLRAAGLAEQPLSHDDLWVALSASNYLDAGQLGPTMWNHPKLRDLLVGLFRWAFGEGVWALKAPSVLLGTAAIPLLALCARRFLRDGAVGCLAALLLALDPVHIDFSRQAIQEVYMMAFTLAGLLCVLESEDGEDPKYLVLAGLAFGLGVASKWYVLFPLAASGVYLLHRTVRGGERSRAEKTARISLIVSTLAVLPFTVYLLTWLPWFSRGYSLVEWVGLHWDMTRESMLHKGYNAYQLELDTNAMLWFLKPVSYVDYIPGDPEPTVLIGVSAPLVWLLTLPAMAWLANHALETKRPELALLLGLFAVAYLPFVITKRPIWVHSAFAVLPYAFTATSASVLGVLRGRKRRTLILSLYLGAVLLMAVPLYLLAIGKGLEIDALRGVAMSFQPAGAGY